MKKILLRLFPSIKPDSKKDPYVFLRPAHRLDKQLEYYPPKGIVFLLRLLLFKDFHRAMYSNFPLSVLYRM